MSLAKRFRKVRKISGLNQIKFSELIGVSQGHVSNIETGKEPNISKSLARVIELLWGISPKWLREGEGNMYSKKKLTPYNIIEIQANRISELEQELEWKRKVLKGVGNAVDLAIKKKVKKNE